MGRIVPTTFTDGTGRRQTEMQNIIIGILTESGYCRVAIDGCVNSEERTSESVTAAIVATFRENGKLLEKWRSVFEELYPDRQDLLAKIPQAGELTLAKLVRDGFAMTDTCNTAQKIQQLIAEAVQDIAKEQGLSAEDIASYVRDSVGNTFETSGLEQVVELLILRLSTVLVIVWSCHQSTGLIWMLRIFIVVLRKCLV
jgi:hypothetical protein